MILPTIQLLRIALITGLLLLLIPLMVITSLIALITLIAMSGLIALESWTGAATTITRPMKTAS